MSNAGDMRRQLEDHERAFRLGLPRVRWWQAIARRFCGHDAVDFNRAKVIDRRIRRATKIIRGPVKR